MSKLKKQNTVNSSKKKPDILPKPLENFLVAALIFAIGVFYLLTFREGHDWGGDNCQYFLHAQNLVKGIPYKQTGVIFNPLSAVFPETYPPVFPFLLVPVYLFFGMSFVAAKVLIVFLFMGALALLVVQFRTRLGFAGVLILLAWVGFNPLFWNFKDYVFSEIPFLFFLMAFFKFEEWRTKAEARTVLSNVLVSLGLGLLLYLAYGTRSIGILLIPSLLLVDILRFRRPKAATLGALLLFASLFVLQNSFLHNESTHVRFKTATFSFQTVFYNLFQNYPFQFSSLWYNGPQNLFALTAIFFSLFFLIFGYVRMIRRFGIAVREVFVFLYLVFFLTISFADTQPIQRYFLPIAPFLIAYSFYEVIHLDWFESGFARKFFLSFSTVTVFILYIFTYSKMPWGVFPEFDRIDGAAEQEVYQVVREKTNKNDVVIFWDPRILTFFTGRPGAQYIQAKTNRERMTYFKEVGARYWLSTLELQPVWCKRNNLEMIFSNNRYWLYQFLSHK